MTGYTETLQYVTSQGYCYTGRGNAILHLTPTSHHVTTPRRYYTQPNATVHNYDFTTRNFTLLLQHGTWHHFTILGQHKTTHRYANT